MNTVNTQPIPIDKSFVVAPKDWLTRQAETHHLRYMLAHADDGIIWGRVDQDGLHTSTGIARQSPELRSVTLQQCRLFGDRGELLVWRDSSGWLGRLVTETADGIADWIDEDHVLWGTDVEQSENGFTLVRDGAQGMRHAVPILVTRKDLELHQLRLRVRHYIAYNDDGEARVTLSRLVTLLPEVR